MLRSFSRFTIPRTLGVAGVAGALLLAACDTLPGDPPPGAEIRPGFADYTRYCARCHGQAGRADRASRIAKKPVSFVDPAWRAETPRSEILRVIRKGKGKMKGLGDRLDADAIDRVADYLLWLPEAAPDGEIP